MLFKIFVANYFFVCAFCKINIFVGLQVFLILLKIFSKEEYRMHMQGQKDCASEGFCIRLASYKRLANVQID